MINRLALCVMMVGSLSLGVTANAVTENDGVDPTLELIEKAEELSEVSGEDVVIVDGYEVAVGEDSFTAEGLSRNTLVLTGRVSVSRPLFGGVMTASASSSTNRIVHSIGVRASVNNNGVNVSNGSWRRLSNTTFVSTSQNGTGRSGIAHSFHDARWTSTSGTLTVNQSNNTFR